MTEREDQVERDLPPWLRKTPSRGSRRTQGLLALVVAAALLLALVCWVAPIVKHKRWSDRVRDDVQVLAHKRPPDVPRGAWEYLVGWTINLHANCGSIAATVDGDWRLGFAAEFERRLAGPITVADIDWIWDEYTAHTKYGPAYSSEYRPTRAGAYLTAEVGCFGIQVD